MEQWAVDLLFGQEDRAGDGFKEISCNNFVRKKFNKNGRTEVYLKVCVAGATHIADDPLMIYGIW